MTDRSTEFGRAAKSNPASDKAPRLDFQEHLAALEREGLLIRVDRPINKDTELHPLVRWQFIGGMPENERRAFLFTNVVDSKGRRYDMPVAVGALAASPRIYSIGMGKTVDEIGQAWSNAIAHPVPPVSVASPPCQQVVIRGEDLKKPGGGLAMLPVPISTPGYDAAPYLTATLCVTRDPQSRIQTMGTYRAALKATDRLGVRMVARPGDAGGYLHWLKYQKRKEKMPMAIVLGCAPVMCFTGPQKVAVDIDEVAVAGGVVGQPIRMARAITIDIDVPADSEIVIEGLIDPNVLEPEAPFGESNGYVALEAFNLKMEVTAITMKRSPVFTSIVSQVTPSESSVIEKLAYEPLFLSHLRDRLAVRGIKRVVMHERLTNLRPVIFLQFGGGTPTTEVWRGLYGAANFQTACGKFVIAVSEDIDPQSVDAVLWSLAYRSNPAEDAQIAPNRGGVQGSQYGANKMDSTMLIDATLKNPMPPLALPARQFMENAQAIWQELGLPPVTESRPWHGYSMGDWNQVWDTFAKRATAGDWEENGRETAKRERAGIKPETPAKSIENAKAAPKPVAAAPAKPRESTRRGGWQPKLPPPKPPETGDNKPS